MAGQATNRAWWNVRAWAAGRGSADGPAAAPFLPAGGRVIERSGGSGDRRLGEPGAVVDVALAVGRATSGPCAQPAMPTALEVAVDGSLGASPKLMTGPPYSRIQ